MVATKLEAKSKELKDDAINLLILIFVALSLGVYLIATTVLIADDGIYYIERAQKLSTDPGSVIKSHPPGYPYLIFWAHKFAMLFSNSSSVYMWIYSAQSVSLLCRVLALVPLYFIGKLLIDSHNSFWALLILIALPYPTEFGSDALRDWPYVFFLATGLLFLLLGIKQGQWWFFGIVGLVAGLGFIVRPECAQLVVYSILWLFIRLLKPKRNMNISILLYALLILLIGFGIPVAPYVVETGRIIPPKLEELIDSSQEHITSIFHEQSEKEVNVESHDRIYTIMNSIVKFTKAIGKLIERISENLMYFFMPVLLIGIYYRFSTQSRATDIEKFIIPVFIMLNVIIMILLYCSYEYISRRHCMPLVVFLIFYVVTGLEVLGKRLGSRNTPSRSEADLNSRRWFFILLAIGIGICLPKLVRPNRIEKKHYKAAALWLQKQSDPQGLVLTFDRRIAFYAERRALTFTDDIPPDTKYIIRKFKSREKMLAYDGVGQERFSLLSQWHNRDSVIAIYGAAN